MRERRTGWWPGDGGGAIGGRWRRLGTAAAATVLVVAVGASGCTDEEPAQPEPTMAPGAPAPAEATDGGSPGTLAVVVGGDGATPDGQAPDRSTVPAAAGAEGQGDGSPTTTMSDPDSRPPDVSTQP